MNRRVFAAVLVGRTLGVPGARADAPMSIAGATSVDAKSVIALTESKPDLVIIDNRRAQGYANGFIEGAVRVLDTDLTEAVLASHVKTKATHVLFYCNGAKCGRAATATEMAVRWGHARVHYYALGMEE